jgi:hypothetical protein
LGAVTLLSASCKKSTYYQLTDEEMTWLCYKNNELLVFENDSGDVVNHFVTIRLKAYRKEDKIYNEFTTAYFQQLNDTTTIYGEDSNGFLHLNKDKNGFLVTFVWAHFPLKDIPLSTLAPGAATIAGINYPDVFVIDATGYTDLRFYNKKLWVSQSRGVLQYEDIYGNIWRRQF